MLEYFEQNTGTQKIIYYLIISTESTIMHQGSKDRVDICDIQSNYSGVFEHFFMNGKGESLHEYLW